MVKVIRKGASSPTYPRAQQETSAELSNATSPPPLLPEEHTPQGDEGLEPGAVLEEEASQPQSASFPHGSHLGQAPLLGEGKDWEDPILHDATAISTPPPPPARMAAVIDKETYAARSQAHVLIQQAEEQIRNMLTQAQQEAHQIVARAREEAEHLRQTGQAQGLEEGLSQGSERFAQLLSELQQAKSELEGHLAPHVGTIALKVARKILGRELHDYPESVVDIAKMALGEKARQRKDIILRAHPEDMAILRQEKAVLLEQLIRTKDITLREDGTIERGGIIIETESGTIDAQIHVQMAAFEAAFARL